MNESLPAREPEAAPAAATDAPAAHISFPRKERNAFPSRRTLSSEGSAALRDQLIAELALLKSTDEAADWVHKNLPAKNTLAENDAALLETSFQDRLLAIEADLAVEGAVSAPDAPQPVEETAPGPIAIGVPFDVAVEAPMIEATAPATPPRGSRRVAAKAIRLRDKEHCKFVATRPCILCGRAPSEAHHIRFAQPRALGRKVSDEYTVPVCRLHHRELHRYGDEASWWAGVGMDPLPIALDLWQKSRVVGPFNASTTES